MGPLEHYTVSINNPTDSDTEALAKVMADAQDNMVKYIEDLAKELNISEECAMDVYYLRTRSRHTQQLEDELIKLHAQGIRPNMCEYGCS